MQQRKRKSTLNIIEMVMARVTMLVMTTQTSSHTSHHLWGFLLRSMSVGGVAVLRVWAKESKHSAQLKPPVTTNLVL